MKNGNKIYGLQQKAVLREVYGNISLPQEMKASNKQHKHT